jgi:hypothetical protein
MCVNVSSKSSRRLFMGPHSVRASAPSSDDNAAGFLKLPPTASRYEHISMDPDDGA